MKVIFYRCLGEAIIITRSSVSHRQVAQAGRFTPDIFEFVYFARPDSVLDGISVYRSRMAMGDLLAEKVRAVLEEKKLNIDVVIPVSINLFVFLFSAFLHVILSETGS